MSDLDDVELVARALAGDAAARRELGRRLMQAVAREAAFAVSRLAAAEGRDPRQEVKDLVHDVLLGLFENDGQQLRRWDPDRGRSLESFVQLIARRRIPRMLSGGRGNPWADAPIDPADIDTADDADLAKRLEQRNQLDQVLAAMHAKMNERDHELFDLIFVQERSPDAVAEHMEMTRGAVNAWSYRMRKLARAAALASGPRAGTAPTEAAIPGGARHG